jgi:hypothetical protein
MCSITGNNAIVQHYFNPEVGSKPDPLLQADPTKGYSNQNISIVNGVMSCSFTRKMFMDGLNNFFNISKTSYYLLVASGRLEKSMINYFFRTKKG